MRLWLQIAGALAFIAVLDFLTPIGILGSAFYVLPVYLATRLPVSNTRRFCAVYGVAALSAALTFVAFFVSPNGGLLSIVIANRGIALLLIVGTAVLAIHQAGLSAENFQLRGLLPICSYCKNIRDMQGRWHSIDRYIHKHTGAQFTHGMCPLCLDEYMEGVRKESTVSSSVIGH